MARLLIISAVTLAIAYYGTAAAARLWNELREDLRRNSGPVVAGREHGSELVACSTCGVHLPRSRAVDTGSADARFYCSEGCRHRQRSDAARPDAA